MNKKQGITAQEVRELAGLSRINLSDGEVIKYQQDLSNILQELEKVTYLEVKGISSEGSLSSFNVWREDEVVPGLNQMEALMNGPEVEQGFFRVPQVWQE